MTAFLDQQAESPSARRTAIRIYNVFGDDLFFKPQQCLIQINRLAALKDEYKISPAISRVLPRAFMKRLKQKRKGKEEKITTPWGTLIESFESTFGIREYILYNGPLTIYLEIAGDIAKEVMNVLKSVQYFGTSDSICTCLESRFSDPNMASCIKLVKEQELQTEQFSYYLILRKKQLLISEPFFK